MLETVKKHIRSHPYVKVKYTTFEIARATVNNMGQMKPPILYSYEINESTTDIQ